MKKIYLIIGLVTLSCLSFAQDNLEFTQKKSNGNSKSIYFQVEGLVNDEQADAVVNDLLDEPNITFARYFISGKGKDRFQIHCNSTLTAEYVREILLAHNLDYDFSTISRNGIIEDKNPNANAGNNESLRNDIETIGFPKYNNTGNKQDDDAKFSVKKRKWIEENPNEYQEMLNQLDTNSKTEISKEEFENFSEEKQNEITNNPDKYIIK